MPRKKKPFQPKYHDVATTEVTLQGHPTLYRLTGRLHNRLASCAELGTVLPVERARKSDGRSNGLEDVRLLTLEELERLKKMVAEIVARKKDPLRSVHFTKPAAPVLDPDPVARQARLAAKAQEYEEALVAEGMSRPHAHNRAVAAYNATRPYSPVDDADPAEV